MEIVKMVFSHRQIYSDAIQSMDELQKIANSVCSTIEYVIKEYIKCWEQDCPLKVQYKKEPSEVKITCLHSTALFYIKRGSDFLKENNTVSLFLKVSHENETTNEYEYAYYDISDKIWGIIIADEGFSWTSHFDKQFAEFLDNFVNESIKERVKNFNP